MELHFIIILFICNFLLAKALVEESKDLPTNSKFHTSRISEDSKLQLMRRKRSESQIANKLTFHIYLSEKVVETIGVENLIHGIENFLHNEGIISSKDIFQLEMRSRQGIHDEQMTSFVIAPPINDDANVTILHLNSIIRNRTTIKMFGFYSNFVETYVRNEEIIWNGVRTAVRLKLIVEYSWILGHSLQEITNRVATFLSVKFKLYRRDIYNLILTQAANGSTMVEFALPPLLSYTNVSVVLENIDAIIGTCVKACEPTIGISTGDACQTCQYISLFGMNIFIDPQSFIWSSETWTGNEVRYEAVKTDYSPCSDHQELCLDGVPEPKCVGIGRCDKNFYYKIQISIVAYGSIRLLDVYGLDYSKQVVIDSLSALHGICKSSMELNFFGHGRDTFGISVVLAPSIGRTEGARKLIEMVKTKDEIESQDLVISKVKGSYRKSYLDSNKSIPKYIENDCFGCEISEVWCLLPNISLCLFKHQCIDMYYTSTTLKIVSSTEIIKFNVLMTTNEEYHRIDDNVMLDIKIQVATQINSRLDMITYVDLVPGDVEGYFELGLAVTSLYNNTELKNVAIILHRLTDNAMLHVITPSAVFQAVPNSILFRQYISGYPKQKQEESNSFDLGNTITATSIAAMVITVITIFIIGHICVKKDG